MTVMLLEETEFRRILREELSRALSEGTAPGEAQEWVPQTKAAKIAGVTPQTIRDWLEAGHLGARGRRGRVHMGRLRAYLGANDASPRQSSESRAKVLAASVIGSLR